MPLMVERRASIQSCCNRQGRVGRMKERVAPGGKGRQAVAEVVDEDRCQHLGVEVAAGEGRVFGPQAVEIEERLEAFEGDFHLPTKAVELKRLLGGELVWGEVGD